jgi:hypothetical protein
MADSVAERYVRLGLRLDRHVEGVVDAYFGPPELAAEIEAEGRTDPAGLVEQAERLLGELDDGWLRDQVSVNIGMRTPAIELLILAIHETYPGHQAERVVKEQLLVRGDGLLEESIVLTPTPQCLVTEGIGASEEEAHAYLTRWGLQTPDMVDHLIRFIQEPTSRSYVMNYPAGFELCQRYSAANGFRSLLTDRVRVGDLLAVKA